jgi:hypothetical protein
MHFVLEEHFPLNVVISVKNDYMTAEILYNKANYDYGKKGLNMGKSLTVGHSSYKTRDSSTIRKLATTVFVYHFIVRA